ncbi:MAG: hypothetical protein ACYC6C_02620 [Coriobacteriia bacterium]
MHGEIGLGGPLFWVLTAFMYGVGALALFVAMDPHRPRRAAVVGGAVGKWLWSLPQAVYFLMFVWSTVFGFEANALVTIFVLATPAAFVAQIAYLLRVVYPSPARVAALEGPGAPADDSAAQSGD